ncbi:MAG: histidine kinase [Flavobacteriales bacterium]|nr:histidine kinase [Flavobacteriales bacterium]
MSKKNIFKASLHFSTWLTDSTFEIRSLSAKNGSLFYGTQFGLYSNDQINESPIFSGNISSLAMEHGLEVIGTFNDGLYFKRDRSGKSNYQPVVGLNDKTVLATYVQDSSTVIVTTLAGAQIVSISSDGRPTCSTIDGLESYYILTIRSLSDERILFGTDKRGLVIWQGDSLVNINSLNGKSIGTVHSISNGSPDSAYMSTSNAGVIMFDSKELKEVISPHGQWYEYTSISEIQDNEYLLIGSEEVALFYSTLGELLAFDEDIDLDQGRAFNNNHVTFGNKTIFEQAGKLYCFHHTQEEFRKRSKTQLLAIEANLEEIPFSSTRLSEDQNNLRFHYNGILYRNPDKLVYQYILEGFDAEWRTTRDRTVSYPHLPPGRYVFRVRSGHDHNLSNADEVSHGFEIKQKFYRRSWFKYLALALLMVLGFYVWRKRIEDKRVKERLQLLQTQSKLMGLKAQLNPHFLFNSFNTIIGLTEEDPIRSVEFTEKLTDFYRMVIEVTEQELIPIESEMEILDTYLELLVIRFDGAIKIQKNGRFANYLVPPMTLQLLIENAVKHNQAHSDKPLIISITEEDGSLIISHLKNLKAARQKSLGVGLSNLKARYQILLGLQIEIEDTIDSFSVRLPIDYSRS